MLPSEAPAGNCMDAPGKKLLVVMGATGAQGGGLVRAILSEGPDSEFAVRAVTRHPQSAKARELAALGASVVAADLDDEASIVEAFRGAHGVFCATFFWNHFDPAKEVAHAAVMARAARLAGVKHAIWSTKEDTRMYVDLSDPRMPTLMGRYKVPHFDAKGEADQVFAAQQLPLTRLRTTFFWESFSMRYRVFGLGPTLQGGRLVFQMPMDDKPLLGIASEDVGKCALAIFKRPREYIGRVLGIFGESLTGDEMCERMSAVLGVQVTYKRLRPGEFRSIKFPASDEHENMYQFMRDFHEIYSAHRDPMETVRLKVQTKSFAQWLEEHKHEIPLR